jgi:hypothetical protein
MTLLELTVIILVTLSLITILFIGARAWRRGSDRAACILNIHAVQKAVRGFSNLHGYAPGATVPALKSQLIGPNGFMANDPSCPGGGTCTCGEHLGPDVIPPIGELYLSCSYGTTGQHVPQETSDW